MMKIWKTILALGLAFLLSFGNAALAFQDLQDDPAKENILTLHHKGIIGGMTDQLFQPKGKLTYAQAVHLLVKGFDLNIDEIRFIKEPKASDSFTQVPDDAWYAPSFIIGQLNGLPIPKDVDPESKVTKEAYADLLFHSLSTKGDYMFIELWVMIADEDEVDPAKMNSIQKLVITKIAELDKDNKFHPKAEITRSEAANMLFLALEFVKRQNYSQKPLPKPTPIPNDEVTFSTEKISDEVNKVTLYWGQKPNGCYGISISRISFEGTKATIYYELHQPGPTEMCTQVITFPKVSTFVSSQYEVEIQPVQGKGVMPSFPGKILPSPDTPVTSNPIPLQ